MLSMVHDRFEVDPPPHPAPRPPQRFRLPAGSVDCHAHVIGTAWIAERSYTPRPAPPAHYLAMLDATGVDHGVLVQPSVHGTDNTLLLQTLRAHPRRLRGIAVVAHDAPPAALDALQAAGVTGLRLNTTTGGGIGLERIAPFAALCAERGWHLQLLVHARQLAGLQGRIGRLPVPVVIDHMGYVPPSDAAAGPSAERQALLALVRDEGAWVKLSGAFRLSTAGPPYADLRELTAALADAAPDRCVWGSDWPQVHFRGAMPTSGELLDALAEAVPDARRRNAILVDNPRRLYGFGTPA